MSARPAPASCPSWCHSEDGGQHFGVDRFVDLVRNDPADERESYIALTAVQSAEVPAHAVLGLDYVNAEGEAHLDARQCRKLARILLEVADELDEAADLAEATS